MKGITKSIIEHYHYGSQADDLRFEYIERMQQLQKLERKIIFEQEPVKKKRMRIQATMMSRKQNKLKQKINKMI